MAVCFGESIWRKKVLRHIMIFLSWFDGKIFFIYSCDLWVHENFRLELDSDSIILQFLLADLTKNFWSIISESMGIFKFYQNYNGYPAYQQSRTGKRLYFLRGSGWLIGPQIGSPTGFIHNGNQYQCPYMIPNGWMYVKNGHWFIDETLIVRCAIWIQ